MPSHEKKTHIIKERKHGLLFKVINSVLVFPLGQKQFIWCTCSLGRRQLVFHHKKQDGLCFRWLNLIQESHSALCQGLVLGLMLFSIFISDLGKGAQCTSSRFTDDTNWADWLLCHVVVPPFRGTATSWRTGQGGTSSTSTMAKANPYICGGITPNTSTCWGPTVWKVALLKRSLE